VHIAQQKLPLPAVELDKRRAAGQPFRVVLAVDADVFVGRQRTGERRSPAPAPLDSGEGSGCPLEGKGLIQPGKLPDPEFPCRWLTAREGTSVRARKALTARSNSSMR
jgi:hypothetical protein